MDNKIVANRIDRLASFIVKADGDYVYDPAHTKKPHEGGPWYQTEKGWTTNKHEEGKEEDVVERRKSGAYGTSPEQLKTLSQDKDLDVRYNVAQNKNTPADVLDSMVDREQNRDIFEAVSRNKNTSGDTLEKMVNDYPVFVNMETEKNIAGHPNATQETLEKLSQGPSAETRRAVAYNPNLSERHLKRMTVDYDPDVRRDVEEIIKQRGLSMSEQDRKDAQLYKMTRSSDKSDVYKAIEDPDIADDLLEKVGFGHKDPMIRIEAQDVLEKRRKERK